MRIPSEEVVERSEGVWVAHERGATSRGSVEVESPLTEGVVSVVAMETVGVGGGGSEVWIR